MLDKSPLPPRNLFLGASSSQTSPQPFINLDSLSSLDALNSTVMTTTPLATSDTLTTPACNTFGGFGNESFNKIFTTTTTATTNYFAGDPLAKQIQELKQMIMNVPGVTPHIKQASLTYYKESKVIPTIADIDIPKRFNVPNMRHYDGSTDPLEHVAHYQEKMDVIHIPLQREACLCRGFGSTLSESALKWWIIQPLGSISSFSQLVNMFNNQFSCSRSFEKLTGDLYRVVQCAGESLKDYVNRFNKEVLNIPHLDMLTATEAFKRGLHQDSRFYEDLVMHPYHTLEEIRSRALMYIRLEDDKMSQATMSSYNLPDRKSESSPIRFDRANPYSKPDIHHEFKANDDAERGHIGWTP